MQRHVHKNKEGLECIPFHLWVASTGSEQDKITHDDPNPANIEKQQLLNRYYKETNVHQIDMYEDDTLINSALLEDLLNPPKPIITATTNEPPYVDPNELLFVYHDEKGEKCMPFHIWVENYGSAEDKQLHNAPNDLEEKADLLSRYIQAVGAYSVQVYEDDILIQDYIISYVDQIYNKDSFQNEG